MTFIKFLFVILIVLPIGVVLYFLLRKLVGEYNAAVKKSQELELRRKEEVQAPEPQDYRRDNPRYDAYRKKMEWKQSRTANMEGGQSRADEQPHADGREKSGRQAPEDNAGGKRSKQPARSKRKRRKERKNKKKDREKDHNQ